MDATELLFVAVAVVLFVFARDRDGPDEFLRAARYFSVADLLFPGTGTGTVGLLWLFAEEPESFSEVGDNRDGDEAGDEAGDEDEAMLLLLLLDGEEERDLGEDGVELSKTGFDSLCTLALRSLNSFIS